MAKNSPPPHLPGNLISTQPDADRHHDDSMLEEAEKIGLTIQRALAS